MSVQTIGVVVHGDRPAAIELSERLSDLAGKRGMRVVAVVDGTAANADVIVAIGGDGTVLRAARTALAADLPLLGINVGRKGFLADIEPGGLEDALDDLAAGSWS